MKPTSYIRRRWPMLRDLPIDLISRSPIARWAPVPLRLIVGYGFMQHGFAKLARARMRYRQFCGRSACPHRISWDGSRSWLKYWAAWRCFSVR